MPIADLTNIPKEIYNAPYCTYSENIITKHMLTGVWGKDHLVLKDEHAKYYKLKRKLDPINFDFYIYSNTMYNVSSGYKLI